MADWVAVADAADAVDATTKPRGGRVVARTRPAETAVTWHGVEEQVTFLR